MTTPAVLTPLPPPRQAPPAETAMMVRLIRESFAAVEHRTDEIASFFYSVLFSLAPAARDLFPVNMQLQRSRLLRALVHMVQMIDRPAELVPFLNQLGRDHRKFGVINIHYEAVGTALLGALREHMGAAWTPAVERAWANAYTVIATTMCEAAGRDQGPAWWGATVVEHRRLSWDLALIRVRPEQPIPFRAGQYLSIEAVQRPRLWRYLSPANAPRPDGQLEFHVRAVETGWVSRSLVAHGRPGDSWRIGPPMGRLGVDRRCGRDVLMVAGGTGIAPMRAMLEELCRWGGNPRVHVFYGGRTPADLYDLPVLHGMAASNPWLTVTPVVQSWPEPPGTQHGTLAEAVTRHGSWSGRDVLVSGSPAMIRATVARMLEAGTPLEHIRYDPFTIE